MTRVSLTIPKPPLKMPQPPQAPGLASLEKKLAGLTKKQGELAQALEGIKNARLEALTSLAKGDASQSKRIDTLEKEQKEIERDLEAHQLLIAEAEGQVAAARQELEIAQAEHRAELDRFIAEREQQEVAEICANVAAREERLISLFAELNMEIAALQVDCIRTGDSHLNDLLYRLNVKLIDGIRSRGLRPLMSQGFASKIVVWPLISPTGLPMPVGSGPLNVNEVVQAQKNLRHAAWTKEIQEAKQS
jgi:hypothetical protein